MNGKGCGLDGGFCQHFTAVYLWNMDFIIMGWDDSRSGLDLSWNF